MLKQTTLLILLLTTGIAEAQTTFGPQQLTGGTTNLRRLKPFDVDGDGDIDLLGTSTSGSTGAVVFVENLDAGGLGTPQLITGPIGGLVGLDFADINGDGLRDLIVGDEFNDNIVWCPGLPGGSYGAPMPVGDAATPNGVVAADLDGDGDLDIACTFETSLLNQVGWFQNDGSGAFGSFTLISSAVDDPEDLLAADLDNDGDLDLVSASSRDDKVAWYRNLGGGMFGGQQVITTGADGARRIAVGDINGDGFLDVASASTVDGQVAWFRNDAGVSFTGQPVLENGGGAITGVAIADIDLDGDMDVTAVSLGTDGARWYENVGFGFFASAVRLTGFVGGSSDVAAFDIDGDSDIDIALNRVGWNENETRIEATYCVSEPNSTGAVAATFGTGSKVVGINRLTIQTDQLPANVFGFFLVSTTQDMVSMPGGSDGILCLGGRIGRYSAANQIRFSGGAQRFQLLLDLTQTPDPQFGLIPIQPGQTWNFQSWYRDSVGGVLTSNFSSALSVAFG